MENPEELSEIIPGRLFLSSVHCRTEGDSLPLLTNGITTVHDLSSIKELTQLPGIRYCTYDGITDSSSQVLRPTDAIYADVQKEWTDNSSAQVLIHCQQGISRSAAVVLYIYMRTQSVRLHQAFLEVKRIRRVILPNAGFMRELAEAETEIFGESTLEIGKHGQLTWKPL